MSVVRPGITVVLVCCGYFLLGLSAANAAIPDKRIAIGERLYLYGIGANGEPIKALVQGDVPVSGTQMTCQSCHGRSGMGTIESGRIPPSIAGPWLFKPDYRTRNQRRRDAYTDITLARAIRQGIDASGKPLDPLMPHFQISDQDMAALAAYLRQLGGKDSPGSDKHHLHVATVIAGDVEDKLAKAELDVIRAFIAARNRTGRQRLRGGRFPHDEREVYRKWSHSVWHLKGPEKSWPAQLARYYKQRPAFALIGGLAAGSWQVIHDFCKTRKMPCLLPDTDLPPNDTSGFYNFYYSRGMYLEADVLSAALQKQGFASRVIAIIDRSDPRAVAANDEFAAMLKQRGGQLTSMSLQDAKFPSDTSAIVLWLGSEKIEKLASAVAGTHVPVYYSASLVGTDASAIPAALRSRTWRVQQTELQHKPDPALRRFRAWARVRHVSITDVQHQAKAYFACFMFAEGVKHTGLYLSRDYLLDRLNHASTLGAYMPVYTRGGVTPWQRTLSRGAYLIDLSGSHPPAWIVP